jgi:amino acid transporter
MTSTDGSSPLHRTFGLLEATAMNMSNMVGVGPFITIPLILASMGGPQAMLGWIVGAMIALCDGMVWAELAAAIPISGGTFEYLKVAFSSTRLGRLLPFLFIWQFILSGPLEIASGNIGLAQYLTYLVPLTSRQMQLVAVGVAVLAVILLYRKISSVGKLMVALWVGMVLTIGVVMISGFRHFDSRLAFAFPPHAFGFSRGFALGLGSAMLIAMYDFLGYYSVCYIGDEVKQPSKTIPRSILISVIVIAAVYLCMNLSIIGVVPWQQAMKSPFIASEFMEKIYGHVGGVLVTLMIVWTAFASVFALMLAYSRIPFAAARDGFFFSPFARVHPKGDFPHVSLLVLGGVVVAASFFTLDEVIKALITTRILIQFIAQIAAVHLLRRQRPGALTYRMALYPVPTTVALLGWLYIFSTSGTKYIAWGLVTLMAGVVAFLFWSRSGKERTA